MYLKCLYFYKLGVSIVFRYTKYMKDFWLSLIGFIVFWVVMIFAVNNPLSTFSRFTMFILGLIQTSFSVLGITLVVLLVISFIFIIFFNFKSNGYNHSVIWSIAWIHIIFTFFSVAVCSTLILNNVFGVNMSFNDEGYPNSISGYLIFPVLLLSLISSRITYSYWFKSKL